MHACYSTSLSEVLDFLVRKVNQSLKGNLFGVTFFDVGFDPAWVPPLFFFPLPPFSLGSRSVGILVPKGGKGDDGSIRKLLLTFIFLSHSPNSFPLSRPEG